MTVNVRKMKPVEMVRFLNSTELGTVLSAATVYRHFAEAGYRIASTDDSRSLSFYRYAAWLIDRRNNAPRTAPGGYDAHREAAAQRQAERRRAATTSADSARHTSRRSTASRGRTTTSAPSASSRRPSSTAGSSPSPWRAGAASRR